MVTLRWEELNRFVGKTQRRHPYDVPDASLLCPCRQGKHGITHTDALQSTSQVGAETRCRYSLQENQDVTAARLRDLITFLVDVKQCGWCYRTLNSPRRRRMRQCTRTPKCQIHHENLPYGSVIRVMYPYKGWTCPSRFASFQVIRPAQTSNPPSRRGSWCTRPAPGHGKRSKLPFSPLESLFVASLLLLGVEGWVHFHTDVVVVQKTFRSKAERRDASQQFWLVLKVETSLNLFHNESGFTVHGFTSHVLTYVYV